jgi:diguanylate cyclase (GGDEF)-like protein
MEISEVELREELAALAHHAGQAFENYRLVQELHRDSQTDGLTNAYNYRYFMSCLQREMQRVSRNEGSLAVLMVDVDNLKEYNDRFGHLGGSAALKELADLLRRNTRAIDIVAKYGGDEFCVLLPSCDSDGAARCAQRVLARVEEHQFENEARRRLTISTGIAVHPMDAARDARELLRRADERLFEAKRAGRNRIRGPSR